MDVGDSLCTEKMQNRTNPDCMKMCENFNAELLQYQCANVNNNFKCFITDNLGNMRVIPLNNLLMNALVPRLLFPCLFTSWHNKNGENGEPVAAATGARFPLFRLQSAQNMCLSGLMAD